MNSPPLLSQRPKEEEKKKNLVFKQNSPIIKKCVNYYCHIDERQ
jgi:hypothetical protein